MNYTGYSTNFLIWAGIALCLVQSAIFAGLNIAIFSVSRLRLEVQAAAGEHDAIRVLGLRKSSNFILATILWGNICAHNIAVELNLGGRRGLRFLNICDHVLGRDYSSSLLLTKCRPYGGPAYADVEGL